MPAAGQVPGVAGGASGQGGASGAGVPPAAGQGGTITEPPVREPTGPVEWTTFNYDADNSRNNRSETTISVSNVANLTVKWTRDLRGNGVTSTPIVVGDRVYVNDFSGRQYALRADNGMNFYETPVLYGFRSGTPLVSGNVAYSAIGSTLFARDRMTGAELWKAVLHSEPSVMIDSSPVMIEGMIITGIANFQLVGGGPYTAHGAIVAIDAMTGDQVWKLIPGMQSGAGVSVWSSAAYDPKRKLMFYGTGNAYTAPSGPNSNSLIAVDLDGKIVWVNQFHPNDTYTVPNGCGAGSTAPGCDFDIGASPNLFQAQGMDVVGAGSKGGLYRVVDRDTGKKVIWEVDTGTGTWWGGIMAVAAVGDDTVYVVNNKQAMGEKLFALDKDTGEERWSQPLKLPVWGALTLANGVLYLVTLEGTLHAFDAAKGQELKTWDVGFDAAGGVSVSNGVVYVSSGYNGQHTQQRKGARVTALWLGPGQAMPPPPPAMPSCEMVASKPSAKYSDVYQGMICGGCDNSFCHGSSGGLSFSSKDEAYTALVGADGLGAPTMGTTPGTMGEPPCTNMKRVVPGDAENSVLYRKVMLRPNCGMPMPPPNHPEPPLSDTVRNNIRDWIMAGAKND